MKNMECAATGKQGMTLVELMVFMTLTLFVFGGVIPVALQASRLDRAVEEKMAAFFACKSVLEELHRIEFEKLTAPGSNFHQQKVNGKKINSYVRKRNNIPFHTQGGLLHTKIKAEERVELVYGSTGASTNCAATVTMEWGTSHGKNREILISESASTVLYP